MSTENVTTSTEEQKLSENPEKKQNNNEKWYQRLCNYLEFKKLVKLGAYKDTEEDFINYAKEYVGSKYSAYMRFCMNDDVNVRENYIKQRIDHAVEMHESAAAEIYKRNFILAGSPNGDLRRVWGVVIVGEKPYAIFVTDNESATASRLILDDISDHWVYDFTEHRSLYGSRHSLRSMYINLFDEWRRHFPEMLE
jgi:hypothetical protein